MTTPHSDPVGPLSPAPTPETRRWTPVTLGGGALPPAGPYSPAVRAGPMLFVSGQVPRDPSTGEMAHGGITEQSRLVLANLVAALEAGGAGPADVVSVTVYLADEQDWGDFNEVYREVFTPPYPTRTAVGARLRGILVEVSAIAYLGDAAS